MTYFEAFVLYTEIDKRLYNGCRTFSYVHLLRKQDDGTYIDTYTQLIPNQNMESFLKDYKVAIPIEHENKIVPRLLGLGYMFVRVRAKCLKNVYFDSNFADLFESNEYLSIERRS